MMTSHAVRCAVLLAGWLTLIPTAQGAPGAAPQTPTAAPRPPDVSAPRNEAQPLRCAAHYGARRYRTARTCFEQLLRRLGPSDQLLFAIGYSSYQLKEYRRALASFEGLLRRKPRDGDAIFMTAMARAQLGHHARALRLFQRALAVGLREESPSEARRYVRSLQKLLRNRLRSGWLVSATLTLGYDSHPRLGGGAAASSTSDGSTGEGSGFAELDLRVGYRWLRPLGKGGPKGLALLNYRFDQLLMFTDLQPTSTRGSAWRGQDVVSGLSLQHHELSVAGRLLGSRWTGGLRLTGQLELAGLRDIAPLIAGLSVEGDLTAQWHRLTATALSAGYSPQWALADAMGYLAGHGVFARLGQQLRWKSRLRVELSYRLGVWWLGTLETPASDCPANTPCGLFIPYSNYAHRGALDLHVRAAPWLAFDGRAALEHRTYWEDGLYRTHNGSTITVQRLDLLQHVRLEALFRLAKNLRLGVAYAFTRNRSTVDADVGIDEGYDRHQVWATLAYRRW